MTPTLRTGRKTQKACQSDLVHEDVVGLAEDVELLFVDGAEAADAEAGSGEGLAHDDVFGETEEAADLADFVLEEAGEGLEELELEVRGEATDVVVALDHGGGVAVDGDRLDDVGIGGALGEEGDVGDGAGGVGEDVDEGVAA